MTAGAEYDELLDLFWSASVAKVRYAIQEGILIARESLKCEEPEIIVQIASAIVSVYAASVVEHQKKMPFSQE